MCADRRLCGFCAGKGKTCCQGRDIFVTKGDVVRIAGFIGQKDIFEFRKTSDASYLDNPDDPTWMECVFRQDTSRRVLKTNPSGDCCFLTNTGCSLPMDVRPLVCRIFPLNFNANGFHSRVENECPVHLLASGETLNQNLGITDADAALWHQMLYSEILLEKEPNSSFN